MVICIVALVVFSFLSLVSAKYRPYARDAFKCVFKMMQFKPCDVKLEEKIKSKVTSKLMKRTPSLARFFYKNFKVLSWIFTIAFFASLIYSAYGIYNLIAYGNCEPGSAYCVLGELTYFISCNEPLIVMVIVILLAIVLVYFAYKYLKYED